MQIFSQSELELWESQGGEGNTVIRGRMQEAKPSHVEDFTYQLSSVLIAPLLVSDEAQIYHTCAKFGKMEWR